MDIIVPEAGVPEIDVVVTVYQIEIFQFVPSISPSSVGKTKQDPDGFMLAQS